MPEEKIIPANLPNNSHKAKQAMNYDKKLPNPPPKVVTKVISGEVTIKKKSILDRASHFIFGDDIRNVVSSAVKDVVIPAAKNMLFEMIIGGVEARFGKVHNRDRLDRRQFVSYSSMFRGSRDEREEVRVNIAPRIDDLVFETRTEAEDVLSRLSDLIDNYDVATVSDFYRCIGKEVDFTWEKYGWTSIKSAYIRPVRGGYVIMMARPRALEEM